MPSYYQDGQRYVVDPARSRAQFRLHTMGVHFVRGSMAVRDGLVVVDEHGNLRTLNFNLDASTLSVEAAWTEPQPKGMFGNEEHPLVEFETQWARQVGSRHELDGVLRMHGHAHVFTLRAERGKWARRSTGGGVRKQRVSGAGGTGGGGGGGGGGAAPGGKAEPREEWYQGVVTGTLDRREWELRAHTLADDALLLLGHDVHFEVRLRAGPRAQDAAATPTT